MKAFGVVTLHPATIQGNGDGATHPDPLGAATSLVQGGGGMRPRWT